MTDEKAKQVRTLFDDEWNSKLQYCKKITEAVYLACDESAANDISTNVRWLIEQVEGMQEAVCLMRDRPVIALADVLPALKALEHVCMHNDLYDLLHTGLYRECARALEPFKHLLKEEK